MLIALGLIGWFLRHGPLGDLRPAPAGPAPIESNAQPVASSQRATPAYVSSAPAKVKPTAVKRSAVKPSKVKVSKVKVSTAKRRPKKAPKRSQHVQR